MQHRHRRIGFLLTPVVLSVLLVVTGCATSDATNSTATTATASAPDLVGTWKGTYQFPTASGELIPSPLTLVIETQTDGALWGYEEYEDQGEVNRVPFAGSLGADGTSLGLAADELIIEGEVTGEDSMRVRFFVVGDTPTSFEVALTRAG